MSDLNKRALETAIDWLEYLALARAENATDRNDAKAAGSRARAAILAIQPITATGITQTDQENVEEIKKRHTETAINLDNERFYSGSVKCMGDYAGNAAHKDRNFLLHLVDRLTTSK